MAQSDSNIEIDASTERGPSRLWLGLHLNGRAVVLAGLGAGLLFLVLELLTAARDVVMLVDYTIFGMAAAWLYVTFKNRAAAHRP